MLYLLVVGEHGLPLFQTFVTVYTQSKVFDERLEALHGFKLLHIDLLTKGHLAVLLLGRKEIDALNPCRFDASCRYLLNILISAKTLLEFLNGLANLLITRLSWLFLDPRRLRCKE